MLREKINQLILTREKPPKTDRLKWNLCRLFFRKAQTCFSFACIPPPPGLRLGTVVTDDLCMALWLTVWQHSDYNKKLVKWISATCSHFLISQQASLFLILAFILSFRLETLGFHCQIIPLFSNLPRKFISAKLFNK